MRKLYLLNVMWWLYFYVFVILIGNRKPIRVVLNILTSTLNKNKNKKRKFVVEVAILSKQKWIT